jgi:hypothetical protein
MKIGFTEIRVQDMNSVWINFCRHDDEHLDSIKSGYHDQPEWSCLSYDTGQQRHINSRELKISRIDTNTWIQNIPQNTLLQLWKINWNVLVSPDSEFGRIFCVQLQVVQM